jgi:hypothetical protein
MKSAPGVAKEAEDKVAAPAGARLLTTQPKELLGHDYTLKSRHWRVDPDIILPYFDIYRNNGV